MQQLCRNLRLLILATLAFGLVCACMGNPPPQIDSQTNSTSTEAVRVVKHAVGKAEVPVNPQRVVVLSDGLDTVLSLGVKPVGSVQVPGEDYYLKNIVEDIKSVGNLGSPSLEAIIALEPDLILGIESDDQNNYKLLSQIAPTVLAEVQTNDGWKKLLSKYAEALNKTDKAKQIMMDYHARIEKFQAKMGDRLKQTEVSIGRKQKVGDT